MFQSSLIYPMFAMVLLTTTVVITLFRRRVRAVRENLVTASYFRIYQGEIEPEPAAKASRHLANLFEAPVLFYVACLAAMVTGQTGTTIVVLAWLYVLARYVHAYVHLGGNRLRHRMKIFGVGWLILLALWIAIVAGVATRSM